MRRRALLCLVALGACAPRLRTVPRTAPPTTLGRVTVDYPPPPAQIEVLPPSPGDECAWMDGHYEWDGRRWAWRAGGWVEPPAGCALTRVAMSWSTDRGGAPLLSYAKPEWVPLVPSAAGGKPATCRAPIECRNGKALPAPPGEGAGASVEPETN
ncbi:MAG: hypothetical protein OZ921_06610 [Sorangiineae bacterium]|nr:hypothetical protein [Polyangiaceae bacterium]MEB2322166.1 hypothetical protein [Sorangiineae bacterium]